MAMLNTMCIVGRIAPDGLGDGLAVAWAVITARLIVLLMYLARWGLPFF